MEWKGALLCVYQQQCVLRLCLRNRCRSPSPSTRRELHVDKTQVIVEQTQFYGQQLGVDYQILLIISTQVLGYAIAGLTRRFLVRPSGMIWPGTLISASMFSTLHRDENKPADGWLISRSKFFLWVFLGSFAFYFLPGLIMPALSYFSIVTWFAPKNVVVANLVCHSAIIANHLEPLADFNLLVRCYLRTGLVPVDLRLGTDRLHWIPSHRSGLGCHERLCWSRPRYVDRCTYSM
jgi:hypothetical protein